MTRPGLRAGCSDPAGLGFVEEAFPASVSLLLSDRLMMLLVPRSPFGVPVLSRLLCMLWRTVTETQVQLPAAATTRLTDRGWCRRKVVFPGAVTWESGGASSRGLSVTEGLLCSPVAGICHSHSLPPEAIPQPL